MYYRANFYSRQAAVNYAVSFALHPNPQYRYFKLQGDSSGDCANFISQCLFAGGAPMNFNFRGQWWYNHKNPSNINDDTWSISWAVANSLFWLLKTNNKFHLLGPKGQEVGGYNLLEPGDLIFFENAKGIVFHSTIVTSFDGNIPLVSHHSFEALNIPLYRSYNTFKFHYLKISV